MAATARASAADDDARHWLRAELLCEASSLLKLPPESTFEPLRMPPDEIPIEPGSPFSAHGAFFLPVDNGREARQQSATLFQAGLCDIVHRFTLRQHLADELNSALVEYALHRECLADVALWEWSAREENVGLHGAEWVEAWLASGPDERQAGVRRTNVGGYQSQDDVFEPCAEDDDDEHERLWGCRQLHRICSAALDALDPAHKLYPMGEGLPLTRAVGEPHRASAWVNVNRRNAFNTMHIHDHGKWTAVYFAADGVGVGGARDEEEREGAQPSGEAGVATEAHATWAGNARRLVLRGGSQARVHTSADAVRDEASHCYMAVQPLPGTLWLLCVERS
jgi:hypothetical protein